MEEEKVEEERFYIGRNVNYWEYDIEEDEIRDAYVHFLQRFRHLAVNCPFSFFTLSQALSWISLSGLFVQARDSEPAGFLNFLLTFLEFCIQMAVQWGLFR